MQQSLNRRQSGLCSSHKFREEETIRRVHQLTLSNSTDVEQTFTAAVNSLDLESCENRYLLSGCSDGSLYIHDLHNFTKHVCYTASCVARVNTNTALAHSKSLECVSWYPSDNRLFLTSGADKQLKLWDANVMEPLEKFMSKGRISHHECSWSSRAVIAVASQLNSVELVDLRTGNASHELRGHRGSVLAVAWSPRESCLLASSSTDGHAFLWDVRSAAGPIHRLNSGNGTAHSNLINGITFTSDGLQLLTFGYDHELRLWNTFNGKLIPVSFTGMKNNTLRHVQMAVGPGTVFVPRIGHVSISCLKTGSILSNLGGHANRVNCCVYREAYHELYSGGSDRNVLVWTTQQLEWEATADQWSSEESDNDL